MKLKNTSDYIAFCISSLHDGGSITVPPLSEVEVDNEVYENAKEWIEANSFLEVEKGNSSKSKEKVDEPKIVEEVKKEIEETEYEEKEKNVEEVVKKKGRPKKK